MSSQSSASSIDQENGPSIISENGFGAENDSNLSSSSSSSSEAGAEEDTKESTFNFMNDEFTELAKKSFKNIIGRVARDNTTSLLQNLIIASIKKRTKTKNVYGVWPTQVTRTKLCSFASLRRDANFMDDVDAARDVRIAEESAIKVLDLLKPKNKTKRKRLERVNMGIVTVDDLWEAAVESDISETVVNNARKRFRLLHTKNLII